MNFSNELIYIVIVGLFGMLLSIALAYIVSTLLGVDKKTEATFMLMCSFGNTSFVGLAFIGAFFGTDGLNPLIIYDQFVTMVPISIIGPIIVSYGCSSGKIEINFRDIISFPPLIALILAFFISNFQIPEFLQNPLKALGDTTVPLALFAIGIRLSFIEVFSQIKNTMSILTIKMFIVPMILFLTIIYLYKTPLSLNFQVAIMELSMPPMILAGAMVLKARLNAALAISSIGVGLILSLFTIPLIASFLQ
jgi:hypothetical protein